MSTQVFWYEQPELLWTYRKVYMDKLKIQDELDNQQAWRIGLYVYEAFSTVMYNSFRKEGQPAQSYCEKPHDFSSNKTEYEIAVASDKTSVGLDFEYDSNLYTGKDKHIVVDLSYGKSTLEYTLTSIENSNLKRTYIFKIVRPDNRYSDNKLTSLVVGSNNVSISDANEYSVSVDASTTSVEIHATTAELASFVEGFGERIGNKAVSLNETTKVEIKVKAQNGNIRTYTIYINKSAVGTDTRNSDATLKSLKIEGVDFVFDSSVLEYNLSVKYDVSSIKIEAIKSDEKANIEYSENVLLKNGINNIEIKVTAENSSVKVYKLNITRQEEVPIVSKIEIAGIDFEFDSKKYDYVIETTLSELNFNVTLSNESATSEVLDNSNLKNGSVVKIVAKDGNDTVTYSFKILNNEKQEEAENTTVSNKPDFFKENEMIISLVVLGVGTFGALVAILIKRKSKIM